MIKSQHGLSAPTGQLFSTRFAAVQLVLPGRPSLAGLMHVQGAIAQHEGDLTDGSSLSMNLTVADLPMQTFTLALYWR